MTRLLVLAALAIAAPAAADPNACRPSPRDRTQKQLVNDLIDRAFGGSSAALVLQALSAQPASEEELAEIRRLIDAHSPKSR